MNLPGQPSRGGNLRTAVFVLAALLGGLATVAPALKAYKAFDGGIDDADITLTYARHIADGHGFVYNVGGERVEGATSLLWTLVCAAVFRLGGSDPALLVLCILLCGLTLTLAVRILYALDPPDPAKRPGNAAVGLFLVLVLSSPGYVTWMTATLMDVTLWGLLIVAAAGFVVRPPRTVSDNVAAGGVWFLLCLTRPEALLAAPAFAAVATLRQLGEDRRAAVRTLCLLGSISLVALGGLTLFRLAYFGWPFPNTFYAKVASSPAHNALKGFEYVGRWILSSPIVLVGCATCAAVCLGRWKAGRDGLRQAPSAFEALAWVTAIVVLLPTATGGDHFPLHRFLQPAYPLICLLIAAWCRRERFVERSAAFLARSGPAPFGRRAAAYGICAVAVLYSHQYDWFGLHRFAPLSVEFDISRSGREQGRRLTRLFEGEPLPSVGIMLAGGFGRTYDGEKIDLLGLNNVRMGHSRSDRTDRLKNHAAFDKEVFFELAPQIVAIDPKDDLAGLDFNLRGLISDARFREAYILGTLRRSDASATAETGFYRRDLLEALGPGGRFEFAPAAAWDRYAALPDPARRR